MLSFGIIYYLAVDNVDFGIRMVLCCCVNSKLKWRTFLAVSVRDKGTGMILGHLSECLKNFEQTVCRA